MILVTLGTQDKEFTRLLKAIDKEIKNGVITDKVVVQAGCTKYKSENMEMFDLIPANEFDEYIKKADLIITHGGAGSILTGVKNNKKIIAAARLAKYKEHVNDHQKQIIKEFSEQGYIMELKDFNKLGKLIQKSKSFKPKKFISNTDNMINLVSDYIEETNNISWYNKYKEGTLLKLDNVNAREQLDFIEVKDTSLDKDYEDEQCFYEGKCQVLETAELAYTIPEDDSLSASIKRLLFKSKSETTRILKEIHTSKYPAIFYITNERLVI